MWSKCPVLRLAADRFQDAFDLYHRFQESKEKPGSILTGPALPALGHAIAGSAGSAVANVTTYPLALIVTRLQIQRQLQHGKQTQASDEYKLIIEAAQVIYAKANGLNDIFIGVESDTAKTIADSFLFFLSYNFLRQVKLRSRAQSTRLSAFEELSVGFLAGSFSKFLTTPIANIVTRKQTSAMLDKGVDKASKKDSIRHIAQQIHEERGITGFWSGYTASLILTMNPTLTFFFFETLKRLSLSDEGRSNPTARATFLLAAISKACASAITYPFSLAKTRLQVSGSRIDEKGSETGGIPQRRSVNVLGVFAQIAKAEGVSGLYDGLQGEILKGFFSHGITMLTKNMIHKVVIQTYYFLLRLMQRFPSVRNQHANG